MPNYTYKCRDCEEKFNVSATIKEREEGGEKFNCPKCKGRNTSQVFSLKSFFSHGNDKGGSSGGCCCGGNCG